MVLSFFPCRLSLRHPPCLLCMSLTISLNSSCGNSVSQKVRMIVLLRMVNNRMLKNSFFLHFEGCLIMKQGSSCSQICLLTPCLLWPHTMAISFLFPDHGCQGTVHPCLYVTPFQFHFLSNTLIHHFAIWPNRPTADPCLNM